MKKHNKTYKKQPTKLVKRTREKNKMLIIILAIFSLLVVSDALFFTRLNKIEQSQEKIVTTQQEVKQEVAEVKVEIKEVNLLTNNPEVEFQIRAIADELNFKWPDYLVRLANCESGLNPRAVNDKGNNPKDSKDRGLFQYNSYWQAKVSDDCAFDIDCSTRKTIEMINSGRQHLWVCNKIIKK